jgi:hypothetical protein
MGSKYYKLMGDTATNTDYSYYNSIEDGEIFPAYDYMVQVYTNTSKSFSWVNTKVNCSDISSNLNMTYNCTGCNNTEYYNVMLDTNSNGKSHYLNNTWNRIPNMDYMVVFYTNSSLRNDITSTFVNCSDLSYNRNITIQCSGCTNQNYYNLLQDSNTSGRSYYYNGTSWRNYSGKDSVVRVKKDSSNFSWVPVKVNCTDVYQNAYVVFRLQRDK